jgi:putative ABC transport system ATP-binding protein
MEPGQRPIIELQDVWKIYRMGDVEVPALQGLTLTIYSHEFVAIMGPSGSGKSTAMNMVGCLDVPTQGSIRLDGEDISKLAESDLAQIRGRKIGFIFQKFNLMPGLTAIENVMLPMTFQDVPRFQRETNAAELLQRVGLGGRMYHKPTELSGGEQQRVAIARAIAGKPSILFADEPCANLDTDNSRIILDLFAEINGEMDQTIVMVSHEDWHQEYFGRVIRLRDGKIVPEQ